MSAYSAAFTIGVEEEYQIIDPVTYELCSDAGAVLREASQVLGKRVQPEIHLSQIEVATTVCCTLEQVRRELLHLRREIIGAARRCNRLMVAAGTHPYSHWSKQAFTPKERYLEMERDYQQLAREQSIFGCHVHVGLSDRQIALQVMNHVRLWLSPLLALAANSPFWWGTDTGYASYRMEQWARWPQAGPPQYFSSLAEYEALTEVLRRTRSVEDLTRIYWDVRISERFPTIEIRIMDVCTTVDDTIMIAGLVRGLIATCYELVVDKKLAPPVRQELLRMAHWRAARYGLDEELVDISTMSVLPARYMVERFLHFVRPALERHGDWEEISTLVHATMRRGVGASRQRAVYQRSGSLEEVVKNMVIESARGTGCIEVPKKHEIVIPRS